MQADGEGEQKKKRSFRRFSYRGVDLEQLLELNLDDLLDKFHARARRKCAACPGRVLCGCLCMLPGTPASLQLCWRQAVRL